MICSFYLNFLRSPVPGKTDEYLFTIDLVELGMLSLVVSRCATFSGVKGPTHNVLSASAEVFPRRDPHVPLTLLLVEMLFLAIF